jgi:cellulose synthase/poly-beta-1,6-N-acetylglucosamine synthase-like glycosyltransferase
VIKASVVIAAMNAEKSIGKCLDSLERQTFKDFEVIVVDDGSSDNTIGRANAYPKVRVLKQDHGGPAVARNNGAWAAKGKIIVFTDSDCILDSNWLGEMVKPFEDERIAGVQGRYKTRQKSIIARLIQLEIERSYERMANRRFIDFMGTYSAAYRKKVFEEMQGFDTSFPIASGEDTDLSFRVSEAGYKMVFRPKAMVYHSHPESVWKYLRVKFFRAFWRTKVYKRHSGKMVSDAYTSQMVKVQLLFFYVAFLVLLMAAVIEGITVASVGIALVLLFFSTLPFALWSIQKDFTVGIASIPLSLLRTAFFGVGFALGVINQVIGR